MAAIQQKPRKRQGLLFVTLASVSFSFHQGYTCYTAYKLWATAKSWF